MYQCQCRINNINQWFYLINDELVLFKMKLLRINLKNTILINFLLVVEFFTHCKLDIIN